MKNILMILCLVSCVFAVAKITKPYTFTSGTPALASQVNGNFDSTITPANKLIDTVNANIPRWKAFSNHDSTFSWMNIDTVKGPMRIDTIYGVDTIATRAIKATTLTGNVIGSVSGGTVSATTGDFSGLATVGSLKIGSRMFNVDSGGLACTLWVDTVTPWNASRNLNAGTSIVAYYKVGPIIYIHFQDYKMTTYAGNIYGIFIGLNLGSVGYVGYSFANYRPAIIAVNGVAAPGFLSDQSTTEVALYKSDLSTITTATGAGSGWQSCFVILRCAW